MLTQSYLRRKQTEAQILAVEVGKLFAGAAETGGGVQETARDGQYKKVSSDHFISTSGLG